MITRLFSTRLAYLSLVSVLCAACGSGPPAPSGKYTAEMPGSTVELDFKDGNRVVNSYTESGKTESMDCTYQMTGNDVTLKCPGGESRTMTLQDGALEARMNDAIIKFTKK